MQEVIIRNRGRVRRGLLVRQTEKRLLVRVAYIAGRSLKQGANVVETWVYKSDLATVENNRFTGVGCLAPDTLGRQSAEVAALLDAAK